MKIPLGWISLYTPLDTLLSRYTESELAHEYSVHTAEIDDIEKYTLDKVVVGKVVSCEKHPDSKKLSIVKVFLGEYGEEQILTGAPNIVEAKYVPVALVGAVLPGDFSIGERMMASMMSRGMICSDDELGLAQEQSEGIMILEEIWDTEILENMIGKSFFDLKLPFPGRNGEVYEYPLRDTTFEIDNKFITNRPDLFSVVGNAREFGAVFGLESFVDALSGQDTSLELPPASDGSGKIATQNCLSYHLMKMEGIQVAQSPFGIRVMMERSGLSAKMDIVDITNLIMTELGQPMHAFDADKIQGDIHVRQAKNGEKIIALNGSTYELHEQDMVIADESGPIALAGVIGGMDSAVSETTTSIIWESACFDATSVRLTAQRHGIRTDASTRYEKSLDPLLAGTTFPRVKEYMNFLGKQSTITSISSYLDTSRIQKKVIDVETDFISTKASIHISEAEIQNILTKLGFSYTMQGSRFSVTVPSWRASKDISIKEDIAEEITRVYGYDKTPLTPLTANFIIGKQNDEIVLRDMTLAYFQGEKWNEVYNYSFSNSELDTQIGLAETDDVIHIQNAFNEEYTSMRRSLAPRLFLNAQENKKYRDQFGFFEIGKVYSRNFQDTLHEAFLKEIPKKPFPEKKMLAGIMIGGTLESLRRTLEGYIERVIGYVPPVHTGSHMPQMLHPGISGSYKEGDATLMTFGVVHPTVREYFSLPDTAFYFESDYEYLLSLSREKDPRFHPISRYQTIPRELNFVMPSDIPTGDIAPIIDAVHPWIRDVHVSSVYEDGQKIGKDKKSVNFSFTLSNHDATISDEDALHVQNMVIEKMHEKGYQLRSL